MAAAAPRPVAPRVRPAAHRRSWTKWLKYAGYTIFALLAAAFLLWLAALMFSPVISWWNTSSFSAWSSDRALASARDNLSANRKVANNSGRIKAIDSKTPDLVDSANTAGERAEGKTLTRQLARERAATVRDQAAEMKNSAAVSRADAAEIALSACDDGDDACIERALKLLRPPFMVKQEMDELAAAKKAAEDAKAAQKVAEDALAKEKAKPAKVVRIPGPTVYLPQPVATPPSAALAIVPSRPTTTPAAPSSGAVPCTFSRHGVAIETFTVSSGEECKRATFEKNEAFIFRECVQKWGQDHCIKQRDIRKQAQGQNSW